ncbi:AcaB family transcriptional regulator [Escherichia coli]
MHTTQASNPAPTEFILPLALFSPPGSRLLQQLIDYDLLVRRTLLAWHLGLITQAEKRDFIATIPRLMLQVFSFVNRFRTTGVTRADVRANSPLAQTMAHKLGNLPKKMLAEILRDAR